ncbi:MAG: hypothetical protein Q8Q10_03330 [bacterium]|nr:hypothetical protein [bacterium]
MWLDDDEENESSWKAYSLACRTNADARFMDRFKKVKRLAAYFSEGIRNPLPRKIGMEVETSFVTEDGKPISETTSQKILSSLLEKGKIHIVEQQGEKITVLQGEDGERYLYELGRQNIEFSSSPQHDTEYLLKDARRKLGELYRCARTHGAYPLEDPILETREDLLMVPDDRDATWIQLDGRAALKPLATISAVQFTIDVSLETAIPVLNRLGRNIQGFLDDYPQDRVWRAYICDSLANYHADRYGGPLFFESISDYCDKLVLHDVVQKGKLVPYRKCEAVDIPLYLRSIWWYFRLRRYGNSLCIEVRPLPRRGDKLFEKQLKFVLDVMNL